MRHIQPDLFGENEHVVEPPQRPTLATPTASRAPVQLALLADDNAKRSGQHAGQGLLVDAAGHATSTAAVAAPTPVPCDTCGRELTNRRSIDRGRGPDCERRRMAELAERAASRSLRGARIEMDELLSGFELDRDTHTVEAVNVRDELL